VNDASVVPLLAAQTEDVKSALAWVKSSVANADTNEIVISGISYGGMVTLLSAIYVTGFKAALPINAGTLSWDGNSFLRSQLKSLTPSVKVPTFIIQDDKECSGSNPAKTLGPLLPSGSKYKIYTSFPQMECLQAHGDFLNTSTGQNLWVDDAMAFFKEKGVAP
jgi:dienelactone hydrolase